MQINQYPCNSSKNAWNIAYLGPQTKNLYFLITRYIKGYRDTGILKTKFEFWVERNFSLIYKTEILHILESNPKINQSSLPKLYPTMEINVNVFFSFPFFIFQALPKHCGVTNPLHKKRVTIKRGHVNIYWCSLVCSARSICLRNITKPLIGGTIYNEILCWLISTSQEVCQKSPTVQLKKKKLNHKAKICINISL